jgi:hypothetical protein
MAIQDSHDLVRMQATPTQYQTTNSFQLFSLFYVLFMIYSSNEYEGGFENLLVRFQIVDWDEILKVLIKLLN